MQRRIEWYTFRRVFFWSLLAFLLALCVRGQAADQVQTFIVDDAEWQVVVRPNAAMSPPAVKQAMLWQPPAPAPEEETVVATEEADAPRPEKSDPVKQKLTKAQKKAAKQAAKKAQPTEESAAGAAEGNGVIVTRFADADWSVTIVPNGAGGDAGVADVEVQGGDAVQDHVTVNGRTYEDVYRSIPYSKAEYLASPGYRHEAAMEILFGQLRPKTVISQYTPKTIHPPQYSPYKPYRYSQTELYSAWRPQITPYSWGFPVGASYPGYPWAYSQGYSAYPLLY